MAGNLDLLDFLIFPLTPPLKFRPKGQHEVFDRMKLLITNASQPDKKTGGGVVAAGAWVACGEKRGLLNSSYPWYFLCSDFGTQGVVLISQNENRNRIGTQLYV